MYVCLCACVHVCECVCVCERERERERERKNPSHLAFAFERFLLEKEIKLYHLKENERPCVAYKKWEGLGLPLIFLKEYFS